MTLFLGVYYFCYSFLIISEKEGGKREEKERRGIV
jgi:hypothetical protein